jgi:hypothetical protein
MLSRVIGVPGAIAVRIANERAIRPLAEKHFAYECKGEVVERIFFSRHVCR